MLQFAVVGSMIGWALGGFFTGCPEMFTRVLLLIWAGLLLFYLPWEE